MKLLYKILSLLLLCLSMNTAKAQCWQSINGGWAHSLAIKQNGTLWTWGVNSNGELGDGTNTNNNTLTQLGIATNWQKASGEWAHSLTIKQDGTLWSWGGNSYGQLGDGANTDKNTPSQIGVATNWQKISVGHGDYCLAIKQDGTLWAWGDNFYGQLGDGTNTNKNIPTQIGTANNWQSISCGRGHSLAAKQNGTLWACGYSLDGELGNGTNINTNTFVQITIGSVWLNFSVGGLHNLFIKQDGTLWTCGYNIFGQLGDGTNTDKNTPIQIGEACTILPIKLISFTALLQNSNNAKLQWQIATAEDGSKYELLRCTDGRSFLPINLQTGNATLTQFNYTDNALPNGTYYYRLKITDKDGKVTYSNIAVVKVGSKEQFFSVYPNPVKRGESLQLSLQNITANKIEIINAIGQIVYSNAAKQTGSIGISISSLLATGQYIVRVVTNDKITVQKFWVMY